MIRLAPTTKLGLLALLMLGLLLMPSASAQDGSASQRSISTIYLNPGDTRLFVASDIRDYKTAEEIKTEGWKIISSKKLVLDPLWVPRLEDTAWYAEPSSVLSQDRTVGRSMLLKAENPGEGLVTMYLYYYLTDSQGRPVMSDSLVGSVQRKRIYSQMTRVIVKGKELPKSPEVPVIEGTISGLAVRKDSGQPVSGASVSLSAHSQDHTSSSWTTRPDGSFRISLSDLSPALNEGQYRLIVHLSEKDWDLWPARDYVVQISKDKLEEGPYDVGTVELEAVPKTGRILDQGLIRGKVVMRGSKEPVPGAQIRLDRKKGDTVESFTSWMNYHSCRTSYEHQFLDTNGKPYTITTSSPWVTGPDGTFEIDIERDISSCLEEGRYLVLAYKPWMEGPNVPAAKDPIDSALDTLWPVREYPITITLDKAEAGIDAGIIEVDRLRNLTDGQEPIIQVSAEGQSTSSTLTLTKSASPSRVRPGDTVTYKFEVKNSGQKDLSITSLWDNLLGDVPLDQEVLSAGGTLSSSVDYTVEEGDASPLTNTATVKAKDEDGSTYQAQASASVEILEDEQEEQPSEPLESPQEEPAQQVPAPPAIEAFDGLARIISCQGAELNRSLVKGPAGSIAAPGVILSTGGSFKEKGVDQPCDPGLSFGPFPVASGGRVNASVNGQPPVPATWSLYNSNTGLTVSFEPRLGLGYGPAQDVLGLGGQAENSNLSGSAEWPGPGRLRVYIGAPRGAGPLTGSCFGQSFTAKVEVVSLKRQTAAQASDIIQDGDRLQTGPGGQALLQMPDGSRLLVKADSVVIFSQPRPGYVRANVFRGEVTLDALPQGEHRVQVVMGPSIIEPRGTRLTCRWDGESGWVAVEDGSADIMDADGSESQVGAGQVLSIPEKVSSEIESTTLGSDLVRGLPFADIPADDHIPEPYGTHKAEFSGNEMPEGWLWQDPDQDAILQSPQKGTLRVTVPTGNELWGYPGSTAGQRSEAPRLLHKATGDFDLVGEILLQTNATSLSAAEFLLYSPGSYLGQLAGQMDPDGLGEHYRILGGGWVFSDGLNRLALLGRPPKVDYSAYYLRDAPSAPSSPVLMKLTRRGDLWKSYWSLDGVRWNLSTRQEIVVPETIWVGWVFKRDAYDGMVSEPANFTLRDVSLATAQNGSLPAPEWDFDQWAGLAQGGNGTVHLELDGTIRGSVSASSGLSMPGDFDVVVRISGQNGTYQQGQRYQITVAAQGQDPVNSSYVEVAFADGYLPMSDRYMLRYATDLKVMDRWVGYRWMAASDTTGYLRMVRTDGNISTYVWSECQWQRLDDFNGGFMGPAYLTLRIANQEWDPTANASLSADFAVEQIARQSQAENWTPPECSLLQPLPLPEDLVAMSDLQVRRLSSDFALGGLFFGPDGTAYAFSNQMEAYYSSTRKWQKLVEISPEGRALTAVESELLAGINRKSGVVLDDGFLVAVDGWVEGGNRYSGLYELQRDGSFRQWNLSSGYGGLGHIIAAQDGGWLFCDFEADNIWRLPAEGVAEVPLITGAEKPQGPGALAIDPSSGTLYCLSWGGGSWPFGTSLDVFRLEENGTAVRVCRLNESETLSGGGLAFGEGGQFGRSLYASDPGTGIIFRVDEDGSFTPVVSGLNRPSDLAFSPLTGDLLVLANGGRELLWFSGQETVVPEQESPASRTAPVDLPASDIQTISGDLSDRQQDSDGQPAFEPENEQPPDDGWGEGWQTDLPKM